MAMIFSPRPLHLLRASGAGLLEPPVERSDPIRRRRRHSGGPPRGSDGSGDWGGGGGGDDGAGSPGPNQGPRSFAPFAFAFVLVAISTLFVAFLLAYLLLRRNAPEWPPPGSPHAPDGLWISTLILMASSVTLSVAGRSSARRTWLAITFGLGLMFLFVQAWLWRDLLRAGLTSSSNAYGAVFYSLTGLHALHLLAGLAFLAFVLVRSHESAVTHRLCAVYWHFLDALWLILFCVLYFV